MEENHPIQLPPPSGRPFWDALHIVSQRVPSGIQLQLPSVVTCSLRHTLLRFLSYLSHFPTSKTKQNKAKNKNKNPIPQNVCTQIFASGSALQKTQTETEQMAIAGGMGKVGRSAMYLGGRVNMICPREGHGEGRGRRVCHSWRINFYKKSNLWYYFIVILHSLQMEWMKI